MPRSSFAYHKSEDDSDRAKPPLGTITCEGSQVSIDAVEDAVFSITSQAGTSPARVLWLRAPDAAAARKWVDAVLAAGASEIRMMGNDGDAVGGLLLLGKAKSSKYEKRYFMLRDSTLSYYKSEADTAATSKKPVRATPLPLRAARAAPPERARAPRPRSSAGARVCPGLAHTPPLPAASHTDAGGTATATGSGTGQSTCTALASRSRPPRRLAACATASWRERWRVCGAEPCALVCARVACPALCGAAVGLGADRPISPTRDDAAQAW